MMTLIATTTTSGNAGTDMGGALTLMAVGMLVVLFTLTLIAVLVLLLRRVLAERPSTPTPVAATATESGGSGAEDGIDPHHLVVISAAVAARVGRAKIHRITMLGREAGRQWVTEGRVVVMGSHHLHR